MSKRTIVLFAVLLAIGIIFGLKAFNAHDTSCNPQATKAMVDDLKKDGILRVQHPPSLSNLL